MVRCQEERLAGAKKRAADDGGPKKIQGADGPPPDTVHRGHGGYAALRYNLYPRAHAKDLLSLTVVLSS